MAVSLILTPLLLLMLVQILNATNYEMHAQDLHEHGVSQSMQVDVLGEGITMDVVEYDGIYVFGGDILMHQAAAPIDGNMLKEIRDKNSAKSSTSGAADVAISSVVSAAGDLADTSSSSSSSGEGTGNLALVSGAGDASTNSQTSGAANVQLLASEIRSHYWGCTIPWEIDDADDEDAIENAIEHWEEHTPFRFKKRTNEDDYLSFEDSDGCSSYIGKQGGKQEVFIGDSCSTGNIIHEIGHALGLFHEHQRLDRDDYVRVNWDNIESKFQKNFEKNDKDSSFDLGKYDIASIMHYPTDAFADDDEDSLTVIGPVPDGIDIGQRDRLSLRDIDGGIIRYFPQCDEDTMNVHVLVGIGKSGTRDELRIEFPDHEFTYPVGFKLTANTYYSEEIVVVEEIDDDELDWIILIKEEVGVDAVYVDFVQIEFDDHVFNSGPKDLDLCLDGDESTCSSPNLEEKIDMFQAGEEVDVVVSMGNSGTQDDVFIKFNSEGPAYYIGNNLEQRKTLEVEIEIAGDLDDLTNIEIIKPFGTDALYISSVTIEYEGDTFESGDISICLDSDDSTCVEASLSEVISMEREASPPVPPSPMPPSPPPPVSFETVQFEVKISIGSSGSDDEVEFSLNSESERYSLGSDFPKDSVVYRVFLLESALDSLKSITLYKENGADSVHITNVQIIMDGDIYDTGHLTICMDSDTSTCDVENTEETIPVSISSEIAVDVTISTGASGTKDQIWLSFNNELRRFDIGSDFGAWQSVEFLFEIPSTSQAIQSVTLNKEGGDAVYITGIEVLVDGYTFNSGSLNICLDDDTTTCAEINTSETIHLFSDALGAVSYAS